MGRKNQIFPLGKLPFTQGIFICMPMFIVWVLFYLTIFKDTWSQHWRAWRQAFINNIMVWFMGGLGLSFPPAAASAGHTSGFKCTLTWPQWSPLFWVLRRTQLLRFVLWGWLCLPLALQSQHAFKVVFLSLHGSSASIRERGENPIRRDRNISGTVSALPGSHWLFSPPIQGRGCNKPFSRPEQSGDRLGWSIFPFPFLR